MDIKLERSEGAAQGKLIVSITNADYQDKLTAALKKLKQKAQMQGFRKGMVPMGLIEKMYGNEAKAEEIQKVLADGVNNYISTENLRVLGEPMLSDDNEVADIANKQDFEFKFDLAFSPEVSVKLDGRTSVDYYNINVDEDAVNKQIDSYRRQTGKQISADTYSEEDLLKGSLAENSDAEDAIKIEDASIMPRFFAAEEQKALFKDAKKGDDIIFNVAKAYEGRESEVASLLKVSKDEAAKHTGDFTFHINEISHFELGEVNEELINLIYPDGGVKGVDEFRAKVKADVESQYKQDSDYKFMLDLKEASIKKAGEINLAEDLLLKVLLQNAQNEENAKQMEAHKGEYFADLRWSLVRNELAKSLGVKIDDDALKESSKRLIKLQMAQYGILNIPEEQLEQFAQERLKDAKQRDTILNNAIDSAIVEAAKKVVKLKEKNVSVAEFNKMFE